MSRELGPRNLLARPADQAELSAYGNQPRRIRPSRSTGRDRMAGKAFARQGHPHRRIERRRSALRYRSHSRRRAYRLARRLQDPVIRDYISPEKFAELCSRNGITPGHDLHFLRRQSELVGLLRALGVSLLWTRKGQNSQRRPGQMESGGTPDDPRTFQAIRQTNYPVPAKRYRQRDPRLRRRSAGAKQSGQAAHRCAFARRI